MKRLIVLLVAGVLLCAQSINVAVLEKDESEQVRRAYLEMKAAEGKFGEIKKALAKKYSIGGPEIDFGKDFKTIQEVPSVNSETSGSITLPACCLAYTR